MMRVSVNLRFLAQSHELFENNTLRGEGGEESIAPSLPTFLSHPLTTVIYLIPTFVSESQHMGRFMMLSRHSLGIVRLTLPPLESRITLCEGVVRGLTLHTSKRTHIHSACIGINHKI